MKVLNFYFIICLVISILFVGCINQEISYFNGNKKIHNQHITLVSSEFYTLHKNYLTSIEKYLSDLKIKYETSVINVVISYTEIQKNISNLNQEIINTHTNIDNYLDHFFINTYENISELYLVTKNTQFFEAIFE